jgi:small subunit ribosomal protein S3
MAVEKKFVQEGLTKALVHEYLSEELERAGYGGMVMNRTPMGTQITVYAEKPGMVIGKGGKLIRKITRDLDRKFRLDNPQIDVQDVGRGDLNSQVVANRLASSLERGWYFRKAGQSVLRRVIESGALGCEIVISGKLTGPRSRTEKFVSGYIKHSGKPAEEIVDKGYSVAVKKLGVIGCQVRIIPPGTKLPDDFQIIQPQAPPKAAEASAEAAPTHPEAVPAEVKEEAKKSELDQLLEAEGPAMPQGAAEPAVEEAPAPQPPAPPSEPVLTVTEDKTEGEPEEKPEAQEFSAAEEAPLSGPEAEALSEQAEAKSDQPEEGA